MHLPSALLMSPYNRNRPVDARWQRIVDLAERGGRANHEHDDAWIRRGLAYLRRLRECRDESDRQQLAEEMPDLHAAHQLHKSPEKLERAEVESRLLARQSIDEVSSACKIDRETLVAYEALFFQVLDRLDASVFILINAVGTKICSGLTESDSEILLKFFGFLKGAVFLELVLQYFRVGCDLPERLEQASRAELETLASNLGMKALVLSFVLPFPQCVRTLQLSKLADELRAFLVARDNQTALPPLFPGVLECLVSSPASEPVSKALHLEVDPESWWATWREAVLAA